MKISEVIDSLVSFKREYGNIDVCKNGSFIGSDIIDSIIVYDNKLILFNSDKEFYLLKFDGEKNDI